MMSLNILKKQRVLVVLSTQSICECISWLNAPFIERVYMGYVGIRVEGVRIKRNQNTSLIN